MPVRLCLLVLLLTALPAAAQTLADTLVLPDVEVEATRGAGGVGRAPFSVAVVSRAQAERATDVGASLETALRRLPGALVADRQNPAIGERIVVRGLGYRAGFGVRGVQVVLDGIPLTLADGQAVLGIADPAFVRRAEIVRGPASALWGNGSGGVIFLSTIPEGGEAFVAARAAGGSYGLLRTEAEAAVPLGSHRAGIAASHTRGSGYRDHSAFEITRARAFADLNVGETSTLRLTGAVESSPHLEHPGARTAEELHDERRREAEPRYVNARAGKVNTQAQVAAALGVATGLGDVSATAYGVTRRLENPLPFAYIDVDRLAGGTRLAIEQSFGPLRATLGGDASVQRDDRTNHRNEAGARGATRTLDQLETVTQAALFTRLRLDLAAAGLEGLAIEGTLRGDRIHFSADDRLLDDGDQSGTRTLGAWSPLVGISYRRRAALLFASFSTAFETPTTTELVNRPGGGGGFNHSLAPQRTAGFEVGGRGVFGRVLYDLALYTLTVRDGLTPFEGSDGRTYYVNRGRTYHRGVEALVEWQASRAATLALTYNGSRLRFGTGSASPAGADVAGNVLPGVPAHTVAARLRLGGTGPFAVVEVRAASGVFADDENTVETDASAVVDVSAGHARLRVGRANLLPFVRVRNVFDARYVGSVVINAAGRRYFEPAPGRTLEAGLEVRL